MVRRIVANLCDTLAICFIIQPFALQKTDMHTMHICFFLSKWLNNEPNIIIIKSPLGREKARLKKYRQLLK